MSNIEYRADIKLFIWKGLSTTEIIKDLADVYDHSALSYRIVAKWGAEFKDPTGAFDDALRSARPTTPVTNENIRTVDKVVMRDRQISVRRVADELEISKMSL